MTPEREQEIRALFAPDSTYQCGIAARDAAIDLLAALDQARAERDAARQTLRDYEAGLVPLSRYGKLGLCSEEEA